MSLPMVLGLGQMSLSGLQNSRRSGYSFSLPRLGYIALNLSISERIRSSQRRLRLTLGARLLGLRASTFLPPASQRAFQLNRVFRLTLAWSSTALRPCFCQKIRISYLLFASLVIISRQRTTSCQAEIKPLVCLNLLKIRIFSFR